MTDSSNNKPVGFYGPIAPPVPNALSSEYPQFGMPPSRAGNVSMGHGSWVKWVTKIGWVTWVMGH